MARMRSPNYPGLGLSKAIEMARVLWEKEKRTEVSLEVAAKALGYKSLSGPIRSYLGTLRQYRLIEGSKGLIKVSELALRILHPANEEERLKALREAALNPELFRELYESHSQASDEAIRSHLITKLKFSPSGVKYFIEAFRGTLTLAKLGELSYAGSEDTSLGNEKVQQSVLQTERISSASQKTRVFSWPLSKDVSAEVKITGGEILPSHLELLRKYLDLAKTALESGDDQS